MLTEGTDRRFHVPFSTVQAGEGYISLQSVTLLTRVSHGGARKVIRGAQGGMIGGSQGITANWRGEGMVTCWYTTATCRKNYW